MIRQLAEERDARLQSFFLSGLLVCHVVAGALLYALDWNTAFSGGEAAANYIREHELEEQPLFGYQDRRVSVLSAYLDKPVFYPNAAKFGTFWTTPLDEDWTPISDSIRTFTLEYAEPVVIVLSRIMEEPIPDIHLELLMVSKGVMVPEESFYIYKATAL